MKKKIDLICKSACSSSAFHFTDNSRFSFFLLLLLFCFILMRGRTCANRQRVYLISWYKIDRVDWVDGIRLVNWLVRQHISLKIVNEIYFQMPMQSAASFITFYLSSIASADKSETGNDKGREDDELCVTAITLFSLFLSRSERQTQAITRESKGNAIAGITIARADSE